MQDESILADLNYKLNTRATELLFLKWFIDHLAPNGRAGVIVPNGVLFGSTNAATSLREMLLTECDLQAVINLPSGVFKPYSGVGTAALIFQKGKADDNRLVLRPHRRWLQLRTISATPIEANDIPDVLAKWPSREEGPNSYRVPIEKIQENDWSLAAGRYKPVTAEAVNHDAPAGNSRRRAQARKRNHPARQLPCSHISARRNEALADKTARRNRGVIRREHTITRATRLFGAATFHWVTPTDLPMPDEGISVVSETKDRITQAGSITVRLRSCLRATVLFSSRATIGKVAIADMPLTTNQGFANFRTTPRGDVPLSCLRPLVSSRGIARLAGSTTFKEVSRSTLRKYQVPVPPLEEQEWIVRLLDKGTAYGDFAAKLITVPRRSFRPFDEMFGDPATNPKGWPSKPFGELVKNQDGRRKPVKASDRAERKGQYPYYGASGVIDFVDEYIFDETALLIAEDGANLLARSTPVAFMARGKYWVNNHAHVVTENDEANLNYLCVALNLRNVSGLRDGQRTTKAQSGEHEPNPNSCAAALAAKSICGTRE